MKSLKKVSILIVLWCGMLISGQGTLFGQPLIHDNDSCICYTINQDKRCLECLINQPKKLEQISLLKSDTLLLRGKISEFKAQNEYLLGDISELKESLLNSEKKRKFGLNLNKYGLPISFGLGIVVTVVLIK